MAFCRPVSAPVAFGTLLEQLLAESPGGSKKTMRMKNLGHHQPLLPSWLNLERQCYRERSPAIPVAKLIQECRRCMSSERISVLGAFRSFGVPGFVRSGFLHYL
jgi:hypothetical protein